MHTDIVWGCSFLCFFGPLRGCRFGLRVGTVFSRAFPVQHSTCVLQNSACGHQNGTCRRQNIACGLQIFEQRLWDRRSLWRPKLTARARSAFLRRSKLVSRASLGFVVALDMVSRACPKAARALEMASRGCPNASEHSEWLPGPPPVLNQGSNRERHGHVVKSYLNFSMPNRLGNNSFVFLGKHDIWKTKSSKKYRKIRQISLEIDKSSE